MNKPRHVFRLQARFGEQLGRPAPTSAIQPRRTSRVGVIPHFFAGQPKSQVVLGQQNQIRLRKQFGFMIAHPCEFWCGKAGEHDIAGQRTKLRVGIQLRCLGRASCIIPEDAGPQHVAGFVQHGCSVHLSGNADTAYSAQIIRKICSQSSKTGFGGLNPIGWVLLAPPRMGA